MEKGNVDFWHNYSPSGHKQSRGFQNAAFASIFSSGEEKEASETLGFQRIKC